MSDTATDQQDGTNTDMQSQDQAGAADPGVTDETTETEQEAGAEDEPSEDGGEEDLLDAETLERVKNDPVAYHKELNRAFTRRSQQMAPYRDFIKALNTNPRQAAIELAQSLGIEIPTPKPTKTEEQVAEDLTTKITNAVKAKLGPDYDDLAEKLGGAIHEAAKLVAEEATAPIRQSQQEIIRDASEREAASALETFGKAHPDWRKHEPRMLELMQQYPANGKVSTGDYLESMYTLATADGKRGDTIKKVVKRMTTSANVESTHGKVPDHQVSKNPGRPLTFDEAAAMALRGESVEL